MSLQYPILEKTLRGMGKRALIAGDTYDLAVTLKRNGAVYDLSGATVQFTVKSDFKSPDSAALLLLDSDSSSEIEITDAPNGAFTLKFRHSATPQKSTTPLSGRYWYDLQVKDSSSNLYTWARGPIEFLPGVTQAT